MKMITERLKFADVFPDKAASVAQRLHIKKDEIPFVRKYYTAEKDKTEVKKKERAVISYISTGIKDRDGEKLVPEGVLLENYQKNPIVPFSHDYKTVPPAKNMWIKRDDKGLIAKTVFAKNQRADDIYQAYSEDIAGTGPLLNAFSVGFIPLEWEDTDKKALEKDPDLPKRIYNKWELLEYSLVPIPSCPEALTIAVEKGLIPEGLKKDLEIEVVKEEKDREIEVEKDETKFKSKIAHIDGMFFEPGHWCIDKEGVKWMWDGGAWIGEDGVVAKKEISIKKAIDIEKYGKEIEIEIGDTISSAVIDIEKAKPTFARIHLDKPEIDIEEATKDITELLKASPKTLQEFVKKYELSFMRSEFSVMDAVNKFASKYNLDIKLNEKGNVVITKPETTDNYHRIPVESPDKHKGHRIRTIVISASKGIKALYCGNCKKVITYLFDVSKWSMTEAQAWVNEHKREIEECTQKYFTEGIAPEKEEYKEIIKSIIEEADKEFSKELKELEANKPQHKERWNRSLSKLFDIASAQSPTPLKFHYELYEKFLECKVKEIFQNGYLVPSPLLGTYLAGFKEVLGEFELKDTRKFMWDGSELPPDYEVIQLNSEKSDDFLIDGLCFYEAEKKPLIVHFNPSYYGITVTLTTSNENKEWNKELLDKVHSWVYENNFLRGEKFSLSGEFLHEPDDSWDNLILDEGYKDSIRKSANFLEKKGKKFTGRGLLFIGPPGTGKTKTGRVLMNELDATFIWVSSKDFRHIGPLRALALGFSLARDLAPSILFLEDIDTWLRGEMEFVTDLIKTEMDGIKQNRGIITILTSNYPEKLPDALLDRPGRFHHIVNFELPKPKHRAEMLELWAGDIGEALLREITEKTDGFSGAHIKELVEFAKMIAEEDEIEIGKALIMSLDKLTEQRELIDEIRANKTDAKAVWGRVKYEEGKVRIIRDREIEIEEEEDEDVDWITRDGPKEKFDFSKVHVDINLADVKEWKELLGNMQKELKEIKEGRVLSRKNRKIVKDAITALNAVLKADSAGSREDEESESGTVTERDIEVVKDGEKAFSKEDIAKVVKEIAGEQMGEILEGAFKKSLDPEKIKTMVSEGIKVELQKLRGRVA